MSALSHAVSYSSAASMGRYPVEEADLVFRSERGTHISEALDNDHWHRALGSAAVSQEGLYVTTDDAAQAAAVAQLTAFLDC